MADLSEKDSASTVKLVGADSSGVENYYLSINPDGSLPTSANIVSPPSSTEIIRSASSSVGSSDADDLYTITNGKTLTIQRLLGGAQSGTDGSKVTLYEDPNGNLSVLNFIATLYFNESSEQIDLNDSFAGNGTRRILMRRHSFSSSTREIFGRWVGYEI